MTNLLNKRNPKLSRQNQQIEIGWEKRTPKSDKIERRRCQYERCPSQVDPIIRTAVRLK